MPNLDTIQFSPESYRRLSPWRVLLAILILVCAGAGAAYAWGWYQAMQSTAIHKPWFAAYTDVTATPTYPFEQLGTTTTKHTVLSFIVSKHDNACTPTWGAAYTLEQAGETLDLDRRIARLRQQKGSIAVSFGGVRNDELAVHCTDAEKLLDAYTSVVKRYNLDTIDLDLEQAGLTDIEAGARRATAIAQLQQQRRSTGKNLAVWVTLPVTTQGLSQPGIAAISQLLTSQVDVAGVNAMVMNFGDSKTNDQSMVDASKQALREVHRQLGILYSQSGITLTSQSLWNKIGATPMIGQNDNRAEVFSLDDAKNFNNFAQSTGVGRMSMWSANRDIPCGENYVDTRTVSPSCSGVDADKLQFATELSQGFGGSMSANAAKITTNEQVTPTPAKDDPATSPYQIWQESGAYLEGTKVVWHGNVYEAKWWTQGDLPDNPVLQSWQTPWKIVGPVLPGEKPISQPTLPAGTYPEWSGEAKYQTGQRVLFNGTPYQAKWWNQGDSPAASSANADSSSWMPLTQAQITEILDQAKK